MAAPISPNKKLAYGRDSWWLVPTIADMSAPTVAEVNTTTGGLNITGFLLSDDFEGLSSDTESVTLPKVLLETTTTQVAGETTYSMGTITVTCQPQAPEDADGKKAWALIKDGFEGYAVQRPDVAGTTGDVTAGEFLNVVPVTISGAFPLRTTAGADGVWAARATVSVTSNPEFLVAAAA